MFAFHFYARAPKVSVDDRAGSRNGGTESDRWFLLRRPDVIGHLSIETLPSVSPRVYRCAGAAEHAGPSAALKV